jgi:hypothetical protein
MPPVAAARPSEPEDPTLEAELDRALGPYRDLLPPELLEQLRETLADALTTHPVGVRLLERVRPPPTVVQSGEAEKDGAAGEEDDDEARGRAG